MEVTSVLPVSLATLASTVNGNCYSQREYLMCLFQKNLNKMKCIIYENTPTGISVKVLLLSMDCCETGVFFCAC